MSYNSINKGPTPIVVTSEEPVEERLSVAYSTEAESLWSQLKDNRDVKTAVT
jgi:hypothetical protein